MKKLASLSFVFCALAFGNSVKAADGGVAVVDLDAVARELGVLDYIAGSLQNMQTDLDGKLKNTQQKLQAEMNKVRKDAGDEPNDEGRQRIATVYRELETQYQTLQARATQTLNVERLRLINEFREELKPHALALAKEKGLSVVLNKVMPPVYVWDESVDITKELTEKARKAGLVKKAPAPLAPAQGKGKSSKGKGKGKGK